jgi:hypothetical protein
VIRKSWCTCGGRRSYCWATFCDSQRNVLGTSILLPQFYPLKSYSPSLLVKIFPVHFPLICTPNFPRSLFFYPEYGSSRFLRSARTFLQVYAASHPPRQYSTHSLPCKPQILHNFQKRSTLANHSHRLQNYTLSWFTLPTLNVAQE